MKDYLKETDYFKILSNPTRIKIIVFLKEKGKANTGDIANELELPATNITGNLKPLIINGILNYNKIERAKAYYLADKKIIKLINLATKLLG